MKRLTFPMFGRQNKEAASGPIEWLIVGLGNPGQKYSETRHNAGWHFFDVFTRQHPQFQFDERRNKGLIARGELAGVKIGLVKPQTYMNLSGEAVGTIARFYKISAQNILVAFDDLDLPVAVLRIRPKGGAGGHKGMQSIIQHLGTTEFPRFRLGIGRPPGQMPVEAYVLQKFKAEEWAEMSQTYDRAVEALEVILREGLETAMNQFN